MRPPPSLLPLSPLSQAPPCTLPPPGISLPPSPAGLQLSGWRVCVKPRQPGAVVVLPACCHKLTSFALRAQKCAWLECLRSDLCAASGGTQTANSRASDGSAAKGVDSIIATSVGHPREVARQADPNRKRADATLLRRKMEQQSAAEWKPAATQMQEMCNVVLEGHGDYKLRMGILPSTSLTLSKRMRGSCSNGSTMCRPPATGTLLGRSSYKPDVTSDVCDQEQRVREVHHLKTS